MKTTKRILCILVVLSLLASLGVGALADTPAPVYEKYMPIGDSIAAGCALTKDGSETCFDQNSENYAYVYSEQYIYLGHDYSVVPNAYHSLVNNELGTELLQCARSGMRAVELRYWLDGVYNDFDETFSWDNTYFDVDGNGFTVSDLDVFNQYVNYPAKVSEADLISINLGSNDVFSFTFGLLLGSLTSGSSDPRLEEIKAFLEKGGDLGVAFGKLVDLYQTAGKITDLVSSLISGFNKTFEQYKTNYSAVMKTIHELNPDVTVVNVGVFNPLRYVRLSDELNVDFSFVIQSFVNKMNNMLKGFNREYDNCYFADVSDAETYWQAYSDPLFWEYFTLKVHPTLAGHRYMAQQILKALPGYQALPFTDAPADAWYRHELAYCWRNGIMNGMSATQFMPNNVSTRAQLAAVLYRMAGSPGVAGMTEPFTDVPNGFWAQDAIIWAYNAGIVKGFTDTRFAPNESVTRAQFVTMLYRYAGSPAVKGSLDFTDSSAIAAPYVNAVLWATANGIVKGYSDGSFRPTEKLTRAQMAVILARFAQ